MSKLFLLAGGALLVAYLGIETRGMMFSGTDARPSLYDTGRGSGSGGGGVFFWGSGYRGGK